MLKVRFKPEQTSFKRSSLWGREKSQYSRITSSISQAGGGERARGWLWKAVIISED